MTEESEAAIDRAFDEGYKSGLLASAPEADYWRAKAAQYEVEIKRLKHERWPFSLGGFVAGLTTGFGLGFTVLLQN